MNFFATLDLHASKLTKIVQEAQAVNDNKLSEFEKKFEVGYCSKFDIICILLKPVAVKFKTLYYNVGMCCL